MKNKLVLKGSILLLILFYNISIYCKTNNDIYFYHLGLKDGLSQINIMSIYQDELGTMWFGTTEGLNRYNGMDIQTFKPSKGENGLTQNTIYGIQGNQAGAIYIHADNDLIRYDIAREQLKPLYQGCIRAIFYSDSLLWTVTDKHILVYSEQTKAFKEYATLNKDIANVTSIYVSKDGAIWLGTTDGLVTIHPNNRRKQTYVLKGERIHTLYEDRKQNIWAGTAKDGVYEISVFGNIKKHVHQSDKNSISNNQIRSIIEDNFGKIWIGTFYGLNQYDPETRLWKKYISSDYIPHSISHSSVFALFKDKQGTIWVGTYFGGVNYFNTEVDIFRYYGANSTNNDFLSFPFVSKMTEDGNHNLWICTEGGGLNCLDLTTRQFSRYMFDNQNLETVEYNNQKCIWYRKDKDELYIGIHNGGLAIFDIKTKAVRRIFSNPHLANSLPNNTINKMQFYNGKLYMLTQGGLTIMDIDKKLFYPFSEDPEINRILLHSSTHTFLIDKKDRLWIGNNTGNASLLCLNLKTKQAKYYSHDKTNPKTFGRFGISDIYESSKGGIFFATTGSGIFKYNEASDDFENYTAEKNGLKSNYCYCISEVPSGNLILLYNKGLSFFDPQQPDRFLFSSSPNFPLVGFNFGSSVYTTQDKEIFIGGVNGLVSFFEENLSKIEKKYNIYFDKLFINNKLVTPNDNSGVLDKALALQQEIELKSNQNNITIEFASSNYLQNTIRDYEYKLDGFDKDWVKSDNHMITYTNLNSGTYTLLVREITPRGENNNETYTLTIKVNPPFYLTGIAFVFYFLLLSSIIIAISKIYLWRTNLETKLKYERKEKERIEELNQTKFRFFTNVSHEFRTPLTLIIGQIQLLLSNNELNPKIQSKILRIQKNADHLQNLISELLDFRKQEQGHNKLSIQQIELISYIKEIFESFQEYASSKKIAYKLSHSEPEIYVYIDAQQFQKAIYNLLSNAFKFTSQGGEIKINIQLQQQVIIQVIDNGIGIPPEAITKVFDRFYQLEYRSSGLTLGTGIGLALTKEIIQSHGGTITVDSKLNEGSVFTITLPLGSTHFSKEELECKNLSQPKFAIKESATFDSPTAIEDSLYIEQVTETDMDMPSVLLVDDNQELLNILVESFSKNYTVHTATDGEAGLEMVLKLQPDIVISDIMMPRMTGKQMCYRIKNNVNTSHIPVILLTAQTSDSQIVDGLMFGADAYVTKPFNIKILLTQCNNILRNRMLLYKRLANQTNVPETLNTTNEHDQLLIEKATEIIRKNFNNPDFDMNMLGVELGMGRSKLYTKIKEITGFTPNEFTLNQKLQEAANMLENQPHMNISDIAFYLGFSSTKYFSKCFKTFYGVVPQEWRKRGK